MFITHRKRLNHFKNNLSVILFFFFLEVFGSKLSIKLNATFRAVIGCLSEPNLKQSQRIRTRVLSINSQTAHGIAAFSFLLTIVLSTQFCSFISSSSSLWKTQPLFLLLLLLLLLHLWCLITRIPLRDSTQIHREWRCRGQDRLPPPWRRPRICPRRFVSPTQLPSLERAGLSLSTTSSLKPSSCTFFRLCFIQFSLFFLVQGF